MLTLIKTAITLLVLAILLVGVSFNALRAQHIGVPEAPGRAMTREERPVKAEVVVVRLDGAIDLILKQGPVPALTVRAEQRLLANIMTIVDGNEVRISTRGLIVNSRKPIQVELTLPALEQLHVFGSGDAKVTGFSGAAMDLMLKGAGDVYFGGNFQGLSAKLAGSGDLQLDAGTSDSVSLILQGSGDVRASGASRFLTAKLTGSGDLHAADLQAQQVAIDVMGAGDAMVFAKMSATINSMGSGDVHVAGKPVKRIVRKQGSGDISWE
jgi:hypothetical protein